MDDNSLKELIQINKDWIRRNYTLHTPRQIQPKIKIENLSINLIGNAYDLSAFIVELNKIIPRYTKGAFEYTEAYSSGPESFDNFLIEARKYFGNIENLTEGKYGELILFTLVEGILEAPMIGSKVLTSFNDQAKGSDGLFLGSYRTMSDNVISAMMIGESKTIKAKTNAIKESLASINRFIDQDLSQLFNIDEFIIAKKTIFKNKPEVEKYIYDCFTPTHEEHKKRIKIFPVFIMYELKTLDNLRNEDTIETATKSLTQIIDKKSDEIAKLVEKLVSENENLKKQFLHFFIVPVPSLDFFRKHMHQQIHNLR